MNDTVDSCEESDKKEARAWERMETDGERKKVAELDRKRHHKGEDEWDEKIQEEIEQWLKRQ